MGLFDDVLNFVNDEAEKKVDHLLARYRKQLREWPDRVILNKLETTDGEAYELTLREAQRRGLV